MAQTRAAIHTFATHCSKLKPEFKGDQFKRLEAILQTKPNPVMDTTKFLYKLATMYEADNNAAIAPLFNRYGEITGIYPCLYDDCEVVEYKDQYYLRYSLPNYGSKAIELDKAGIINKFYYKGEVWGDGNDVLESTMQLIDVNNQGIINNVKNSAVIRFIAKISNAMIKDEDVEKHRDEFAKRNLTSENQSGLIIADGNFKDIKQVDSKQVLINPRQMQQIDENVYNYFNINKDIMQNSFTPEKWSPYYEGKIEAFAIQASLVIQNMLVANGVMTNKDIEDGCGFYLSTNRLQHASNETKLKVSTQLFDRGLLNRNSVMDIWNMPHVEDGDKYYIRKEYAEVGKLNEEEDDE